MKLDFPGAVPEIPVDDLAAAAAYYKDNLGFTVDWSDEELGLAGLSKGNCRIFMANAAFRKGKGNVGPILVWLNLNSKDEVNDLYRLWSASHAELISEPESKLWGLHEFIAKDPDGNLFRVFYDFGTPEGGAAKTKPRMTSLAPQFLIDDLARSITYYQKLGFTFGEPWDGFYAIGTLDGLELHLKVAPKDPEDRDFRRKNEHLDAAAGVDGVEIFYEQCVEKGAKIIRPLAPTDWGTKDFYVEDPDGYIISFGGK